VEKCYETYLGRPPDASGSSHWVAQFVAGASEQSVLEGILGSTEFYTDAGSSPAGFVEALYRDLLGRAADPGGLTHWEAELAAGAAPSAVVSGFLSSEEYRSDFVETQYSDLLHRTADPAGLAFWVSEIQDGTSFESVVSDIAGSSEFYADATS
jgi:hypothetical protein